MTKSCPHFLVWGSKGFIGAKALGYFSKLGDCDSVSRSKTGNLDFFSAKAGASYIVPNSDDGIRQILNITSARVVLNTAAMNDIDLCTKYPIEARSSNVDLPTKLAFFSKEFEKKFIHLSSDAIFGQNGLMYAENIAPHPISIYGKMKLESELAVSSLNIDALIIRTRPFGNDPKGKNLFNFFANRLKNNQNVDGYTNSFFTPIYVGDLLHSINLLSRDNASGKWHVAGSNRVSKYQFGTMISRHLHVDPKLVLPKKYEITDGESARGLDTSLDTEKFTANYGAVDSLNSGILKSIKELIP